MPKPRDRNQRREEIDDPNDDHRTVYEIDYTAILWSKAFRRLRHKTQVFFLPNNDHVTTRLDHSLYVSSISSVVCNALARKKKNKISCDPVLASAIAIGHDLGHTPFGHAGESTLDELMKTTGGFQHEKHSLRIVDKIEKPRQSGPTIGLNLTLVVRDGIANHYGEGNDVSLKPAKIPSLNRVGKKKRGAIPCSHEGCIVRLVDKVAYLGRDLEDAIMLGIIKEDYIPVELQAKIGSKNGEIVNYFVSDMIQNSTPERIGLSDQAGEIMLNLKEFNYNHIYKSKNLSVYEKHVQNLIQILFHKFVLIIKRYEDRYKDYENDPHTIIKYLGQFILKRRILYFLEEAKDFGFSAERIAIDFLSTLTDRFALDSFHELHTPFPISPQSW